MPRRLLLLCLVVFAFAANVWAGEFDCVRPPYGEPLAEINDHGQFVKSREGGGVTYYNYTGPCAMGVFKRLQPVIAYGVVDGKLYCRVMRTENDDIDIIKKVTTRLAGTPETETDGDWLVMSWDFPEKRMKMKLKYNNVTKSTKSAIYYEPLRPKAVAAPEEALEK